MEPFILYRNSSDLDISSEIKSINKFFPDKNSNSRVEIPSDSLVIGRYSVLPFYKELEFDIEYLGSKLINSYKNHLYVADISNWYLDLHEFTPKTYFNWNEIPNNSGPLVVKGNTNSRKFSWKTHMYASNKIEASEVAWRLEQDAIISCQKCVYREFIPLKTYYIGFQGLPVTEEYRFFILDGKILTGAYYWSNAVDDISDNPDPERVPKNFLNKIIERVGNKIRFYVIDVARTENDEWIVIELNDGQMSGLSENNPDILYQNLRLNLSVPKNPE